MTNATKTLSLIFGFSVVLLLLQFFSTGTAESEIFQGNLVSASASQVNRITIDAPSDTSFAELEKVDGTWQVHANNETFAADSLKIKAALREWQSMEVEALVTRDPQKHSRYRVDSTGSSITLFNGDEQLDQFIVSSSPIPGSIGDIYVRLSSDDNVFSVNGLNRTSIETNFNFWRDLTIWRVPPESITEVRFIYPADSSFTIQKENGSWMAGNVSLDPQKTSTLATMLGRLRAAGYPPDEVDASVSTPMYSIEFSTENGETNTLHFYRFVEAEPAPFYLSTASDYPYTFTLSKRNWDQAALLSLDDYRAD